MTNRFAPLARVSRFDAASVSRQSALLEGALQKKTQADSTDPPWTITPKLTGTVNARIGEITRIDTLRAAAFVVLPDPLKNLGQWLAVKFAAGATNNTITVSSASGTIDGDATYVLNVPRQIVWFYATVDGWERGSTL